MSLGWTLLAPVVLLSALVGGSGLTVTDDHWSESRPKPAAAWPAVDHPAQAATLKQPDVTSPRTRLLGASPQSSTLTVTKTGDTSDGICDVDCSLREAIAAAVSGDSITVPAGTYTLTLGSQLTIDKSLTLNGAGSGDTIVQAATERAVANFSVFNITASGDNVAISGVTIQHGNPIGSCPTDGGGGVYNRGSLTLTNSTVSRSAAYCAGGIYNNRGTVTLVNSAVNGNIATKDAGGIYNRLGTVTIVNSTVSGNSNSGIYNIGSLTLTSSTVSRNTGGGGIYNADTLTPDQQHRHRQYEEGQRQRRHPQRQRYCDPRQQHRQRQHS